MPNERILIVDDDHTILRLLESILLREHYEVETANNGTDALSKIQTTRFDVILLDLMMPDVSGVEVLKILHARIPQARCVVIMTAAAPFEIAMAVNPNVFATLRKPFNIPELIAAVRGCIDSVCVPVPLRSIVSAA